MSSVLLGAVKVEIAVGVPITAARDDLLPEKMSETSVSTHVATIITTANLKNFHMNKKLLKKP